MNQAKSSQSILIVEDDTEIRNVTAEILESEGYAVEIAANGEEGLRQVDKKRPGLVLLDMRMPVLDGWGFVNALKERGVKLPILVMTAANDAHRWATEINAEGFLAKPFDLVDLLAAVERCYGSA